MGGSASLETALKPVSVSDPVYHNTMSAKFRIVDKIDSQPKQHIPYRIETSDGKIIRGVTDEYGHTQTHYGLNPDSINLFFE